MRVLIMGEESQEICKAFLTRGHNAYSCDFKDCSGDRPDRHIKGDMFEAFNYTFYPALPHLIIVHPTCTFMCNSGVRWLYKDKNKCIDSVRWDKMKDSAIEFLKILNLPCNKIAVENPIMHYHAKKLIGIQQSQIIQPWQFGHTTSKATCLWLKGLPPLRPTQIIPKYQRTFEIHKMPPGVDRPKNRSKTFTGIALAMAEQWG